MQKPPQNLREFTSLLKVVEALRGPAGCPWDKEQTHQTLTRYAIEEAFELAEAMDAGHTDEIRDELGDVLLQVILNSEIARQEGHFDIHDVIQNLNEKMVRRHPHVFSDTKAETSEQVLLNWHELKKKEKATRAATRSSDTTAFDIPQALPALMRSQKIGEKTQKLQFDWTDAEACWPKIKEEVAELEEAMHTKGKSDIEAELGDVLFSLVQLARHLQIDAEQALRKTNTRFETRLQRMRAQVIVEGLDWSTLSPDEKERRWKQAKSEV